MSTFYEKAESFEIPISTNGNVYHERITVYLAIQKCLTLLSNISKKGHYFQNFVETLAAAKSWYTTLQKNNFKVE